jgi:hypothetical protein
VVTVTAAISTTVYASILSLRSLDLIKHKASGAEHAQHIWPQSEISARRKFSCLKFKAAGPDEPDRLLWRAVAMFGDYFGLNEDV